MFALLIEIKQGKPQKIITQLPANTRSNSQEDAPQSVIHVPTGFKDFREGQTTRALPDAEQPPIALQSPTTPEAAHSPSTKVRTV